MKENLDILNQETRQAWDSTQKGGMQKWAAVENARS